MRSILVRLSFAALVVAAMAGCGSGSTGPAGATGATGATGAPGAPGAPGTNAGVTVNGSVLSAADWQALTPTIDPASVSVTIAPVSGVVGSGAPVAKFKVTDQNGYPVIGLGGQYPARGTAVAHTNYNLSFTLSKLVPGTSADQAGTSTPSRWVNLLVTSAVAAGTPGAVVNGAYSWTGGFPSSDQQGKLVDNGDGTYQYTFFRDITQTATIVNGLTDNATHAKADLHPADLVFDPTATHRLGIIIQGSQPGTGINTPTATATTDPVPLVNTFNLGFDFRPDGGTITATRDIVTKGSCSDCHAGKGIGHWSYNSGQSIPEAVPGTCSSTGKFTSGDPRYSDFSCLATAYNSSGVATSWGLFPNGIPPGASVGRNDPMLCVTCHTDQMKYGQSPVTGDGTLTYSGTYGRVGVGVLSDNQAALIFPRLIHQMHMGNELVKTGYNAAGSCIAPTSGTGAAGVNTGTPGAHVNFCFNYVGLPQNQRDCTKCHDGSATKSDGSVNTNQTPDGDNWKNVPSQLACGACHDGINFATGLGVTLQDKETDLNAGNPVGTTQSGHQGGAQADDSACTVCHRTGGLADIQVLHETSFSTLNNPVAKAGVDTLVYKIQGVTVNAAGNPVITFQIQVNGTTVTQLNQIPLVTNGATGAMVADQTKSPIPQFPELLDPVSSANRDGIVDHVTGSSQTMNGLAFVVAFAVPQDGIAVPADYNVETSVNLTNLLVPFGASPNAGCLGTFTPPSTCVPAYAANGGYFTATLTGDTIGQPVGSGCTVVTPPTIATCVNKAVPAAPLSIPGNAAMVTAAMIGGFTQTNLAAPFPAYTLFNDNANPVVSDTGGLHITAQHVKATASSCQQAGATAACTTPRRLIADINACNNCHEQLGTNPDFHSGDRNDPTTCNFCHNGNRVDSAGWPADSSTWMHAIHGSSKRTVPFTPAGNDYSAILYPGVLKNCNQCHLPNTVNYATTGGDELQPRLLWTYTATGTVAAPTPSSPIALAVSSNAANALTGNNATSPWTAPGSYGAGFSYSIPTGVATAAASTALVNSPIASACSSCHDDATAYNHMTLNGGVLHQPRGSGSLNNPEACLACHGQGTLMDAVVVHQQQ